MGHARLGGAREGGFVPVLEPAALRAQKTGKDARPSRFQRKTEMADRVPLVALQLKNFVLDAEFLTLQIGDRVVVW